jgi:hypothetical protein
MIDHRVENICTEIAYGRIGLGPFWYVVDVRAKPSRSALYEGLVSKIGTAFIGHGRKGPGDESPSPDGRSVAAQGPLPNRLRRLDRRFGRRQPLRSPWILAGRFPRNVALNEYRIFRYWIFQSMDRTGLAIAGSGASVVSARRSSGGRRMSCRLTQRPRGNPERPCGEPREAAKLCFILRARTTPSRCLGVPSHR